MERWGWISIVGEPTLLILVAVGAGLPIFLLPSPAGLLLSAAVVILSLWMNRRLEESVRDLPVRTGPESLLGQKAVVLTTLDPIGTVRCGGEEWRAVEILGRQVDPGERVTVVRIYGLQLEVEIHDQDRAEAPAA